MKPIQYDDASHTYSCNGLRYTSATQLLDSVKYPFDTKRQAELYAQKAGRDAAYWEKDWEQIKLRSLDRGNSIHNLREEITNNRAFDTLHGRLWRVQNADLFDVRTPYSRYPDGLYTERIVWNHKYRIAGRADRFAIETVKGKRYVHIDDYKTNKFIRKVSFFDYNTGKHQMLKPPLDHLMQCEFIVYSLQLSLYMYMFESMGLKPGKIQLIHFPHIPEMAPPGAEPPAPVYHRCKYMKSDVTRLLNHHKRTHERMLQR